MAKEAADLGYKDVSIDVDSVEAAAEGFLYKSVGSAVIGVVGFAVGVEMGLYATYQFCEVNIDKFVEYFKKNTPKIKIYKKLINIISNFSNN